MNKNLFKAFPFLLFASISTTLFSQTVGMNSSGATPSSNAILDLNTGNTFNQGVIIPHVELGSSLSTFGLVGSATTKDTGMLIYNSISSRQSVGIYYWNGTTWVGLSGAGSGWSITGNSGTSPGTNFLGTTDAEALEFKADGQKAGWIDYASPYNTTLGWEAGNAITSSATLNTAIGLDALYSNTKQSGNISVGDSALYTQSYSTAFNSGNVAVGNSALYANQPTGVGFGSDNTAIGEWSLRDNTSGYENTANGWGALYANTTGTYNTAIGVQALYTQTTATYNTAVGFEDLKVATGQYNTGVGATALLANTTGGTNTAVGTSAMYYNTTGSYNTGVGANSLQTNTTGTENTALGDGADNGHAALTNTTALGYGGGSYISSNNVSNAVQLGNSSVTKIYAAVNAITISDSRVKTNVQQNVPGLSFINLLTPVTFNYSLAQENSLGGIIDTTPNYPGKHDIEGITFSGFLAQDVQTAANSIGYNFSGVVPGQIYGLRYSEFVVPLVKAVQQLSASTDSMRGIIKNYSTGNYSNSVAIGNGVEATAANTTIIGNSSAVFCGINGAAYNSADALVVGTSGTNGNGAYLTVGGTWTNTSDRNKKENFSIPDGSDVLNKVCSLPVFRWNYKNEPATVQHIGPMAQDFYRIFHVGNDSLSISTIDPAGVALIAVKELNKKLEAENAALKAEITQLTKNQDARFSNDEKAIAELKAMVVSMNQLQASAKQ